MESKRIARRAYLKWCESTGKSKRTTDNYYHEIERFVKDTRIKALGKIDENVVHEWINNRDDTTTAGTRKFKLACIKGFMHFCTIKGYIPTNPVLLVKVDIRRVNHARREAKKKLAFDKAEYLYLLNNVDDPFWKACIAIGVETGLRFGDIVQLEWDCLTETTITVWTDKKNKRVSLKMSNALQRAIHSIPYEHSDKYEGGRYLFPLQRREFVAGNRAQFSMAFKRLLKKHGIVGKSFHCTRVTFATRAKKRGGTLAKIAIDLGHSSVKTTEKHYIQ